MESFSIHDLNFLHTVAFANQSSGCRASVSIQRFPKPCGWSSPRPTPKWPKTSWSGLPTPLHRSKAPGRSSLAEIHVSTPPAFTRASVSPANSVYLCCCFLCLKKTGQLFPLCGSVVLSPRNYDSI